MNECVYFKNDDRSKIGRGVGVGAEVLSTDFRRAGTREGWQGFY